MSKFESKLEQVTDVYFPREEQSKRTTNEILDEGLWNTMKATGKALGGIPNAINKFADGAAKFNQAADKDGIGALGAAAKGAAQFGKEGWQNFDMRAKGGTEGDVNLLTNINSAWSRMTKDQQAMYSQPNPNMAQLAARYPQDQGLKKMAAAKGYNRYRYEQEFAANPANAQHLQAAGLQKTYSGRPSPTNASEWDNWVQTKWAGMEKSLQDMYGDYANFEKIKRAEAQGTA